MALLSFLRNRKFFLVYQMGKVGSKAISETLRDTFGKSLVKHTHDHLLAQDIIKERVNKGQEVVIITGFREPLSRCISAYFQNIDNPQNPYWHVGSPDEVRGKSAEWLIEDFKRREAVHVAEVVAPWLSRFQDVTGLSAGEFERRGSLRVASSGGLSCYIYKLENLERFFDDVGSKSPLAGLPLARTNVGKEKWYKDLYGQFTSRFKTTSEDYRSLYRRIDYVDWLYEDEEIRKLTSRYIADQPLAEAR